MTVLKMTARDAVVECFRRHPGQSLRARDVQAWIDENIDGEWKDIATTLADLTVNGNDTSPYTPEEKFLGRVKRGVYRVARPEVVARVAFRRGLTEYAETTPKTAHGKVLDEQWIVSFGFPRGNHEDATCWVYLPRGDVGLAMVFGFYGNFSPDDLICKVVAAGDEIPVGTGASVQFNGNRCMGTTEGGYPLLQHHGDVTVGKRLSRQALLDGIRASAPGAYDALGGDASFDSWPFVLGSLEVPGALLDAMFLYVLGIEQVKRERRGEAPLPAWGPRLKARRSRRPRVAAATPATAPYRRASEKRVAKPSKPAKHDPDTYGRGRQSHNRVQNRLAKHLTSLGLEPYSPPRGSGAEYDVAWEADGTLYVAEVKSIKKSNEEKQLRLGLGQVLRYRHTLATEERPVVAVLVPEREPNDAAWAELCADLGMLLAWPEEWSRLPLQSTE